MAHAFLKGLQVKRTWFCTKVPFPNRQEATRAMKKFRKDGQNLVDKGLGTMRVYRCPHCKQFHHGHR